MKKIVLLSMLAMSVSNVGFAASSSNICSYLTYNGRGSHFMSPDKSIDASLWYNSKGGDGISGGIGAIVNQTHLDSALTNSHCYSNGNVVLYWAKDGFSGSLKGKIDLKNYTIKVDGTINNQPVTNILVFTGYR